EVMASRAEGSGGSAELLSGAPAPRAITLNHRLILAVAGVAALIIPLTPRMAPQSPAPRRGGPPLPARAADPRPPPPGPARPSAPTPALSRAGAGGAALIIAGTAGMALQSPAPREGGPAIPARAADAGLLPKGLADLPDDYGDTARIAKYLPATAAPQPSAET